MTSKRPPENERVKRRYLQFLKEVKGRDEASLEAVAKALERFDEHSRRRDFRKFHVEQAIAFKAQLAEQRNFRTGEALSASTINATLAALKAFIVWLADRPGLDARHALAERQCAGEKAQGELRAEHRAGRLSCFSCG